MNKIKPLFLLLIIFSSASFSQNLYTPPPVKLLLLEYEKVLEGNASKGAHGLKEHCYKLEEIYVVYSENNLGSGYAFLSSKPDQQCIATKSSISKTNKLGLTIGITRQQASALLGIELMEGDNKIVWQYQRAIQNLPYDDQTTLNITIKNGKVHAIILFNTVTN